MSLLINESNNIDFETNNQISEVNLELSRYISVVNNALDNSFLIADINQELKEFKIRKLELIQVVDHLDPLFQELGLKPFSDEFIGPLPIYGIRQNQYTSTKNLFSKILNNASKIVIHENSSPVFRKALLIDLLFLLSRPSSRELLLEIENGKNKITFVEGSKEQYNLIKDIISLPIYDLIGMLGESSRGEKLITPLPHAISAVHELIHFYQTTLNGRIKASKLGKMLPTLGSMYTNLKEQQAITGIGNDLFPNLAIYENKIRNEFGIPSRARHQCNEYDASLFLQNAPLPLKLAIGDGAGPNIIHYLKNITSIDKKDALLIQDIFNSNAITKDEKRQILPIIIRKGISVRF